MPTTVTETDTFPTVVRKPSNGELADSASFDTFIDEVASRTRYLYNRTLTAQYDVTRASFSAVGSGAVNAQPGIQAALDACDTAGGGSVFLPPGVFRIDSGLTIKKGTNLIGTANDTIITLNHATADLLTFGSGASAGDSSLVENIAFEGSVANTGKVFVDTAASTRIIRNCSINFASTNLQGYLSYFTFSSNLVFEDCYLRMVGSSGNAVRCDGGSATVRGGKIVMPATFSGNLVAGTSGIHKAIGVTFDTTAHVSGSGVCFSCSTPAKFIIADCYFEDGGTGTKAISFGTGADVLESGCRFNGMTAAYTAVGGPLLLGSSLSLQPYIKIDIGVGTACTVDPGYRSATIRSLGASPTITLPTIYFSGQTLDLALYNLSGGTWGFSVANYGFKATQPTLSNNTGASARFVAADPTLTGTLVWVQVGGWGTIAP